MAVPSAVWEGAVTVSDGPKNESSPFVGTESPVSPESGVRSDALERFCWIDSSTFPSKSSCGGSSGFLVVVVEAHQELLVVVARW